MVGSVVRPVKELKGFEQAVLKAGESKKLSFTIDVEKLRFYNDKLQHIYEPGEFRLFVGGDSQNVNEIPFSLTAGR
jgi:beta-glucosidase